MSLTEFAVRITVAAQVETETPWADLGLAQ
jgi:hypothetical protein